MEMNQLDVKVDRLRDKRLVREYDWRILLIKYITEFKLLSSSLFSIWFHSLRFKSNYQKKLYLLVKLVTQIFHVDLKLSKLTFISSLTNEMKRFLIDK